MSDVPEWLAIPRPEEIHREPWREYDGPCTCKGCTSRAAPQQVVYTLHFDPRYEPYPDAPAYKCAGHYTGKTREDRLPERLNEHEEGRGARITQVQRDAGGAWRLASVEPGGADRERQLKKPQRRPPMPDLQNRSRSRPPRALAGGHLPATRTARATRTETRTRTRNPP
jgi:hypothetical protein